MAQYRSIVVVFLLAAWLATPALACLPNPQMTDAEMACCKKMAGDCHMGAGHHPCCKTSMSRPLPVANLERYTSQIQPCVEAILPETPLLPEPALKRAFTREKLDLPPPSPPSLISVLRI